MSAPTPDQPPPPGPAAAAWRMAEHWPQLNLAFTAVALDTVERLLRGLDLMVQRGQIKAAEQQVLATPAHRLRQAAKRVQQIVRLHSGQVRLSHEKIDLSRVLDAAVLERKAELAQLGVQLQTRTQALDLLLDPSLGYSLCQALLDWGLRLGQQLELVLELEPQQGSACLWLRAHSSAGVSAELAEQDSIEWLLLHLLATTDGGIEVSRQVDAHSAELRLRLRRVVTPP